MHSTIVKVDYHTRTWTTWGGGGGVGGHMNLQTFDRINSWQCEYHRYYIASVQLAVTISFGTHEAYPQE